MGRAQRRATAKALAERRISEYIAQVRVDKAHIESLRGRAKNHSPWDCGNPQCGLCRMDSKESSKRERRKVLRACAETEEAPDER